MEQAAPCKVQGYGLRIDSSFFAFDPLPFPGGPKVKLAPSSGEKVWANWEFNLLKEYARRKKLLGK